MPKMHLTKKTVEKLAPTDGRAAFYRDDKLRGDADLAPRRPLLDVIAENPGPVVNFWDSHPDERERRRAVFLENLSRGSRRLHGDEDDQ